MHRSQHTSGYEKKTKCENFILSSKDKLKANRISWKGAKLRENKIKRNNRLFQKVVHGNSKQKRNSNSRHGLRGLRSQFVDVFHWDILKWTTSTLNNLDKKGLFSQHRSSHGFFNSVAYSNGSQKNVLGEVQPNSILTRCTKLGWSYNFLLEMDLLITKQDVSNLANWLTKTEYG